MFVRRSSTLYANTEVMESTSSRSFCMAYDCLYCQSSF